jgi:hypothetical protein
MSDEAQFAFDQAARLIEALKKRGRAMYVTRTDERPGARQI